MDMGIPFDWTALDTSNLIYKSWFRTKQTTISNIFALCWFKKPATAPSPAPEEDDMILKYMTSDDEQDENEDEDDNIPLSVLANNLRRVGTNMDENEVQSYITADDTTPTIMSLSDEDIIQAIEDNIEVEGKDEE